MHMSLIVKLTLTAALSLALAFPAAAGATERSVAPGFASTTVHQQVEVGVTP